MILGYPPAIIKKKERLKYFTALEKAQTNGSLEDYLKIIFKTVDRSLDIYLKAISGETMPLKQTDKLLKIGALAKETEQNNSTIRHWTKEGLLDVAEVTNSGYQMYSKMMVDRIKLILELKQQRLTLHEIKQKINP